MYKTYKKRYGKWRRVKRESIFTEKKPKPKKRGRKSHKLRRFLIGF